MLLVVTVSARQGGGAVVVMGRPWLHPDPWPCVKGTGKRGPALWSKGQSCQVTLGAGDHHAPYVTPATSIHPPAGSSPKGPKANSLPALATPRAFPGACSREGLGKPASPGASAEAAGSSGDG